MANPLTDAELREIRERAAYLRDSVAPTLAQCIEREREAARRRFLDTCPDGSCTVCAPLRAARAATDEAVAAAEVEARVLRGTLRNLRYHLKGRYDTELVKMINDVVPPDEDDTTGGASDE